MQSCPHLSLPVISLGLFQVYMQQTVMILKLHFWPAYLQNNSNNKGVIPNKGSLSSQFKPPKSVLLCCFLLSPPEVDRLKRLAFKLRQGTKASLESRELFLWHQHLYFPKFSRNTTTQRKRTNTFEWEHSHTGIPSCWLLCRISCLGMYLSSQLRCLLGGLCQHRQRCNTHVVFVCNKSRLTSPAWCGLPEASDLQTLAI